jgi:hypothetical protein
MMLMSSAMGPNPIIGIVQTDDESYARTLQASSDADFQRGEKLTTEGNTRARALQTLSSLLRPAHLPASRGNSYQPLCTDSLRTDDKTTILQVKGRKIPLS